MDIEQMAAMLPETPRDGMYRRYFELRSEGELGGDFLLFHRESLVIAPEIGAVMGPEDWAAHEQQTVRRWGAVCTCTACGEEFFAGYCRHNGVSGIELGCGPDGLYYDGYPYHADGTTDWDTVAEVAESETIPCPICGSSVQLVRKSDLREGRTYQLAVASVENVSGYTAVITWLVRRRIDGDGERWEDIRPRDALVIDEDGAPVRFVHTRAGGGSSFSAEVDLEQWEYRKGFRDGLQKKYYNYDSINHLLYGGEVYRETESLGGTTGEKTGLDEYIRNGGAWPQMYLKAWTRHRHLENLEKTGFHTFIENTLRAHIEKGNSSGRSVLTVPTFEGVNFKESKPHRMLDMTKAEYRDLKPVFCDPAVLAEYAAWRKSGQPLSAAAFAGIRETFSRIETLTVLRKMYAEKPAEWEIQEVMRYVRSHRELSADDVVTTLLDYQEMYREQHRRRRKFTHAELWPVALRREHDLLSEQQRFKASKEERQKLLGGFRNALQTYGALEWTDGKLCIRLPRDNGELYTEGKTLRHCVGGYGKSHVSGKDTIFFVRKYRRPERSYYTLDICMTSGRPYEVQLHGYGNERHGAHLENRHSIPPEVRAFVDRWKAEVLLPWYEKNQGKQKQKARNIA